MLIDPDSRGWMANVAWADAF